MDRDEEVRNADWAKQLTGDPRWIGFWDAYKAALVDRMLAAKTVEGTIKGKDFLAVVSDVRAHFEVAMVNGGKFAAHEIKLDEERKKRIWPWGNAA